jgi:hypothetical protein
MWPKSVRNERISWTRMWIFVCVFGWKNTHEKKSKPPLNELPYMFSMCKYLSIYIKAFHFNIMYLLFVALNFASHFLVLRQNVIVNNEKKLKIYHNKLSWQENKWTLKSVCDNTLKRNRKITLLLMSFSVFECFCYAHKKMK